MKRTTMRLAALGVAGCLTVAALAGCSAPADEPEAAPEPQQAYGIAIGTEDAGTATILMANDTGQAITTVATRTVDAAIAPDAVAEATSFEALPFSAEAWEPGQLAALFVDDPAKEVAAGEAEEAAEAEGASSAEEAADEAANEAADGAAADVVLTESVDLQVTLADGATYVLHGINPEALAQAGDVAVHVDADVNVAYLTYTEDGAEVSTLMAETQAAEAERALADAAAAAQGAAEVAADQAAAGAQSAGAATYDSVPEAGSGSAPAQSEDACIDEGDLVLK